MPRAALKNGIELEYDTFGTDTDPALLLIQGLTGQLTAWEVGFCEQLADGGHFVIRFDNRDCGLSTTMDGAAVDIGAVLAGGMSGQAVTDVPYTLSDMAGDAVGLLDHLGIERAHVLGVSMGGMIAQVVSIEHPSRVRSLISVMSMTGELEYATPAPEAMTLLMAAPPSGREELIARAPEAAVLSSKRYFDPEKAKVLAAEAFDRRFYPEGATRQLAAIFASGSRADALSRLDVPTLVIHGREDTLIPRGGGQRTADVVPGSTFLLVADMGHDLPEPLWPLLTGAVVGFTHLVDANASELARATA